MIADSISRLENPVAISLKENILLENKIYELKGDTYNQSLTLLVPAVFREEDLSTQLDGITDRCKCQFTDVRDEKGVEATLLLQCFFAAYVLSVTNKEIDSILRQRLERCLEMANKLNYYKSNEIIGLIAFCLSLYKKANTLDYISNLKERLEHECRKAIKEREYNGFIDLSIGLKIISDRINYNNQDIGSLITDANIKQSSLERVAKLLVFASEINSQDIISRGLPIFEHKIIRKFSSHILPDIEVAVFETLKLINTNLSPEEIKIIINSLKGRGIKWVDNVKDIDREYITTRLPEAVKIPPLLPAEDVFSLIAISKLGIEKLYYIKEDEYSIYQAGLAVKKGHKPFNKKQLISAFLATVIIITGIVILSLISYRPGEIKQLLSALSDVELNFTPIKPLFKTVSMMFKIFFKSPFSRSLLPGLLVLWYILKFNISLLRNGAVLLKTFWLSIPIVPSLINKIKNSWKSNVI